MNQPRHPKRRRERPATWIAAAFIAVNALIQILVFGSRLVLWTILAVGGIGWIVVFGLIGIPDRERPR